jgi:localization factor PodJL
MSKSTAGGLASVSPGARRLAEQAASRAGVTLEEWLDRANAELADEGPAARGGVLWGNAKGGSARDLQERLRASAATVEQREKPGNPITAKARDPTGSQLDSTSVCGTSDRQTDSAGGQPEGKPDWQIGGEGLRGGRAYPPFARARNSPEEFAAPAAFDLESAISQIASRRRALDAQQAHDGLEPAPRIVADPKVGTQAGVRPKAPPTDSLKLGLHVLSGKLDALRREWSDGTASDLDSAASWKDLAQRVSGWARDERAEPSSYDRKAVAAGLERRIEFVAKRIDALADSMVRPEVVDSVRRQMQEVHDLLLAAARRSFPIERIEAQITKLVDRVEAWSRPKPDPSAVESTGRRLDAALQQSQRTATRLETSLDALNAKLESAGAEPLAALIRDLWARFEATEIRDRDRTPIEPILSKIVDKLDRLPRSDGERETAALRAIDHELKSLRAKIETSAAPDLDQLAEDVAQRLEGSFAATDVSISKQFADLNGRLDILTGSLDEAGALQRTARDLMEKLKGQDNASERTEANAEVVERLSALRKERTEAERRAEALLQDIRDVLDRLIDRLSDDSSRPRAAFLDRENDGRGASARVVNSAGLAGLGGFAPRPPGSWRERAVGDESAPTSEELDDEFLIEPGAGAPEHIRVAAELAQAIGSRTNPAISVHIAAARRAAQSALAEAGDAKSSTTWPRLEENVQHARRFCAQHKRSLLLAAFLVLALTAVARMMGPQGPLLQKSEANGPNMKPAATLIPPGSPSGAARAGRGTAAAVDATPIGSIGRSAGNGDSRPKSDPIAPDLMAAIPSDTPSSLREQVLAGSPSAQYDLAQRLLGGHGAPQDQATGAFWLERAASAGFAPAEFRLGALYQRGVGVDRDPAAAKRWYLAAARLGNARAAHNLGVMDAEAVGEKADYAEAAKWFRRAAEMGVRDSQFNLAVLYARGLGVDQDLRQSWMWFSLAAAQGDLEASRKRDEVAAKMNPDALDGAAGQLSKFRAIEPDPAANDGADTTDKASAISTAAPTPPPPRD